MKKPAAWLLLGTAAVSQAGSAWAQTQACSAAYEHAQTRRTEADLLGARAAAVTCADLCPKPLAKDCARWLAEIEPAIPKVVLEARSADGASLFDVSVELDGKPLVARLEGKSLEVNPGKHHLHFARAGAKPVDVDVVIVEADKNQRVIARFDDVRNTPTRSGAPAAVPRLSWLLGGVGVVALGASAYFGFRALDQRGQLDDLGCRPACPPADVAALSRSATAADVALGVGIASLLGAAASFWTHRSAMEKHLGLSTAPLPGGGLAAGVAGRF